MKEMTSKQAAKEMIDFCVKKLAMTRALVIKTEEMTEQEVTDIINKAGERYGNKYNSMSLDAILLEEIGEMLIHAAQKED